MIANVLPIPDILDSSDAQGDLIYDDADADDNYDIAHTHDDNVKLRERPTVKEFFEELPKHRSLADKKTREWLGDRPFYMSQDAIPLFTQEDKPRADSEDYQLHLAYTCLEPGRRPVQPDHHLLCLSRDDQPEDESGLVVGLGRLFINFNDGQCGRISKWTGYEVFVDQELALWMVFDRRSINPNTVDWYPCRSELTHSDVEGFDHDDNQQDGRDTFAEQQFDTALLLHSFRSIESAHFQEVLDTVQKSRSSGRVRVSEVERSKVDELLQDGFESSSAKSTVTADAPRDSVPAARFRASEEAPSAAIAADEGKPGTNPEHYFYRYGDNSLGMVPERITPTVVEDAAKDEIWGEHNMAALLTTSKDEVRAAVSKSAVTAAAGNKEYGDKIMQMLLSLGEEVVSRKITVHTILAVANNRQCGAAVLDMLLKANNARTANVITATVMLADKIQHDWLDDVKSCLINLLEQSGHPIPDSVADEDFLPEYLEVAHLT